MRSIGLRILLPKCLFDDETVLSLFERINAPVQGYFRAPNTILIGVGISGGVMRHTAGYSDGQGYSIADFASAGHGGTLEARVEGERWYKVGKTVSGNSNRQDCCQTPSNSGESTSSELVNRVERFSGISVSGLKRQICAAS